MTVRQDMAWESLERRAAGAAGVHECGDAGIDPTQIRMDTVTVEPFKDMGVEVDETRSDDGPRHFQGARRLLTRNRRRDTRNPPVLDGDIEHTIEVGRWIDDGTT